MVLIVMMVVVTMVRVIYYSVVVVVLVAHCRHFCSLSVFWRVLLPLTKNVALFEWVS